jgi:ABC-2 type transport system ATP-binding protein
MSIIDLKNITLSYDDSFTLQIKEFSVEEGDFFAIAGADDAGKTTMLDIITGMKAVKHGTVKLFDQNVRALHKGQLHELRYVPDNIIVEPDLTAQEYLSILKRHTPDFKDDVVDTLCEQYFKVDRSEKLMEMTYRDNKLISIIAAIASAPSLLILDEPGNFLDNETYRKALMLLKKMNSIGMTILIAVEKYEDVQDYCTKLLYLKDGNTVNTDMILKNRVPLKVVTFIGGKASLYEQYLGKPISQRADTYVYSYRATDPLLLKKILLASGCKDFMVEDVTLEEEINYDFSRWL